MDTGFFAAVTGLSGGVVDFLMQQSLYAAAVAVVVWTVLAIVRPRHPLLHLTLWWFVLARLVLPADLATSWSLRASAETMLAKVVWPLGEPHVNVVGGKGSVPVAATAPPPMDVAALPVDTVAATASTGDLLPVALFLFWLGGVAAMAILLARSERSARHTITMAEPAEDPLPMQLVAAWSQRFRVSRPVRVLVTQEATAPFTAGVLRPVIVLPRTLLDRLDAVELSAVIGHEMSHIRSFDAAWRMAERVLLVLFFFHPMVWMAVRRIDTSREAACDVSAASSGVVARNAYAKSLLAALKAFRIEPEMAFARTLSIQGGTSDGLKTRLVWLKGETAMSTPAKVLGAVGIVGLGLLVLPMAEARQSVPQIDIDALAAAPAAPAVKAPAAPRAPEAPQAAAAPHAPVAPRAPSATRVAGLPDEDFAASLEASIEARIEAEEAAREAELEAAEARRDARLEAAEAQREAAQAEREARLAAAEARREAEQAAREARVQAQLAANEAHRSTMEAYRAADTARRDALLKASEARREAAADSAVARRKAQDVARSHGFHDGAYSSALAGDRYAIKIEVDADAMRRQTLAGVAANLRAKAQQMRAHPEQFDPQGKRAFVLRGSDGLNVKVAGDIKEAAAELEAEANRLEQEARGR